MIGMMYLVLTAMLALNVQKEVVKAFMKVDKGLTITVDNYVKKNSIIYNDFEASFAQFPAKTGPYRAKALEVKQRADEVYNFIQDLKIMIIKEADGQDAPAINGREIDIEKVVKYDENNIPSQILVGANEDGKAYDLMAALNEYRKYMIETLDGKNPAIEESLMKTLVTDKVVGEDGQLEPWPNGTFQLMPLVGANALLTKIQVDVRNAETEVINFLYTQIDKASFKFNKLEAVVIPKSTYVTLGSNYEASVFISASDSLSAPVITVNGNQVLDLDESNKGIYSVKATALGTKKWGGFIALKSPDGSTIEKRFDAEYSVGEANATISATAVNIMYADIDNPLDIMAPNIRPDKVRVKINVDGEVSKKKVMNARTKEYFPGDWAVKPKAEPGKIIQVTVSGEDESGRAITYPPKSFRIKPIPNPEAQFGGKNFGPISKGTAIAMNEVYAVMKDFEFDLIFKVTGFTMSFPGNFGTFAKNSTNSKLTPEQLAEVKKLTRGQKLIIENITVLTPAGKTIGVNPIVLTID